MVHGADLKSLDIEERAWTGPGVRARPFECGKGNFRILEGSKFKYAFQFAPALRSECHLFSCVITFSAYTVVTAFSLFCQWLKVPYKQLIKQNHRVRAFAFLILKERHASDKRFLLLLFFVAALQL